MKKIFILLTLTALIVLSGCSHINVSSSHAQITKPTTPETTTTTVTTTPETTTTPPPTEAPVDDKTIFKAVNERSADFERTLTFVGDSICSGLKVYGGFLTANQCFAEKSMTTATLFTRTSFFNGHEYPIKECVRLAQPSKLYIWLGINEMPYTTKEKYLSNLLRVIEDYKTVSPNTKYTIVSMSPTRADYTSRPNSKIREYNAFVSQYLSDNNSDIGYLDVYKVLSDDNGDVIPEYGARDGVHLNKIAYDKILSYMYFLSKSQT